MKKIVKYSKEKVTVNWQPDKCTHSAKCVHGLPSVFNQNAKPWVNMDGASLKDIKSQVTACPSGALSLNIETMEDVKVNQDGINTSKVEVMKNGPYIIKGPCTIIDEYGKEVKKEGNIALCRCGASSNKPYCDGSHKDAKVL